MKTNMGTIDRVLRIGAAITVLFLLLTQVTSGPPAIVLGVIATVLVLTSFVGVCPLYSVLKLSTAAKN